MLNKCVRRLISNFRTPVSTKVSVAGTRPVPQKLVVRAPTTERFNNALAATMTRATWAEQFLCSLGLELQHNTCNSDDVIVVPVTLQSDFDVSPLFAIVAEAMIAGGTHQASSQWVAKQVELTFATPRVALEGIPALVSAKIEDSDDGGCGVVRLSLRNAETRRVVVVGSCRVTSGSSA